MPYSISTPIVAGSNLQDLSMWQALFGMANQRLAACGFTALRTPASADDIQNLNLLILPLQSSLGQCIPYFCNTSLTYDGNYQDLFHWDQYYLARPSVNDRLWTSGTSTLSSRPKAMWTPADMRSAAGLPVTYSYDASGTESLNPVRNSFLRRKRPRQVLGPGIPGGPYNSWQTATTDAHGNPAIAGQRAYIVTRNAYYETQDLSYPTARCVASGNWVQDGSMPVDVLDNTLAQPDRLSSYDFVIDFNGSPTIIGGSVQSGDYFGAWLLEELRQMFNLLRWRWDDTKTALPGYLGANNITAVSQHYSGGGQTNSPDDGGYYGDDISGYPGAVTKANATWASRGSGTNVLPTIASILLIGSDPYIGGSYYPSRQSYGVNLDHSDCTYTLTLPSTAPAHDVEWYVYADVVQLSYTPTVNTFDAQGDPVVFQTTHKWRTDSFAGATISGAHFGTAASVIPMDIPPDPSPDPGTFGQWYIGYQALTMATITKFDVYGGFDVF